MAKNVLLKRPSTMRAISRFRRRMRLRSATHAAEELIRLGWESFERMALAHEDQKQAGEATPDPRH